MNAAIDIGTNTVLLLVADEKNGRLNIIEEQQRIPRLGRGVDRNKNLSEGSMSRVIEALKEYQSILQQRYSSIGAPVVTATSAVRDANNRKAFLDNVSQETGFEVKILSGFEEAQYTFLGAQSVLTADDATQRETKAVLDIGGGSTEIAIGERGQISDRYSFDMGCVRFTERFLDTTRISQNQIEACKSAAVEMLKEYPFYFSSCPKWVGVAGTVTSLAFMHQGLEEYESDPINGYQLSTEIVEKYIALVYSTSSEELINRFPAVMKGRADIFLAGLLILKAVMEVYDVDDITVSSGGIRHGALILNSA